MKYINIMIWINRIIFGITAILYLTIFLGMYAQIVLGISQVLTAIILLFFIKKLSIKNQNRLTIYWGLVIGYGLLWLAVCFYNLDDLWVVIFIFIPLSIAAYFTFILESLKTSKIKDHENTLRKRLD